MMCDIPINYITHYTLLHITIMPTNNKSIIVFSHCVSVFSFPSSVAFIYIVYKICIQHLIYNSNSLFYYIQLYVHIANNLTEKKSIFGVHQLTETPILPFNLSIQAIMEFKTRRSLCL